MSIKSKTHITLYSTILDNMLADFNSNRNDILY